ncbi:hypothetical protein KQI38_13895 [Tissierella carlieri]|uniref:lectin like domain-containing protein n=1 Tax=Tissierella carlieri TaxID=689904 RepID=UPI001C10671B|nr:lectin like domain-containing protein [Tissierella carlieri]MBU5313132.1 hypothetical protein [Tissierella carlieri]
MKLNNMVNKLEFILILSIVIMSMPINIFASDLTPRLAPMNPEFLDYINEIDYIEEDGELNYMNLKDKTSIQIYERGIIPEPFIINRSSRINFSEMYNRVYPERFDLRNINKVTSIKDQGRNGSCWTFAAYSSLESYLMPREIWDFSEKNMRNNHGFDYGPNDGGNRSMSTAYMARWEGPVLEADDPYDEYGFYSPSNLQIQKHLTNVLYIPDRKDYLDNELIKYALMEYGAVQTSIYSNEVYYNSVTASHYYNGSIGTDHAVSIVGWDDNYSLTNFRIAPPGDGAFIVKNSWGTNWGEEGYFYVSYYDTNVGKSNAIYIVEEPYKFDSIYQYDPLGMVTSMGYGTDTGWFANVFRTGDRDKSLEGVGFFVSEDNCRYEVYVNTDYMGNLNNSRKVASGEIDFAGYHTIEFPGERISRGSNFAVIVKIISSTGGYQIPLERQISGYTSGARAEVGQSFIGYDGFVWTDVNQIYPNTNVNLKAFTIDKEPEPQPDPYEEYETWGNILHTTLLDYSWTIKLSMPLDNDTVDEFTVYIIDEDYNKLSFITPEVQNDTKYGYIKLNNNGLFEVDRQYWIIIEDILQSVSGKMLEKRFKIPFIV